MHRLSNSIERKFVDVIELDDEWLIETDTGYQPLTHINKTIEYDIWELETEDGLSIEAADDHIVFRDDHTEVFVKDLVPGEYILTKNGRSRVSRIFNTKVSENMYDVTVDSDDHRFYSNGILSHNTAVMAAYILWFAMFNETKTVAVLANKGEQAQEIMDRIRLMYEFLPFFLQTGAVTYNKKTLEFDNRSKIFSAATSSSSIRGRSVDLCYIDEAAFIENDLDFYESTYPVISSGAESRVIMTTTPKGTRGMFYNLWRESDEGKNYFKTLKVTWEAHPKRNEQWKKETLANIGASRFNQEFEVNFRGSSGTLIPADILETLQWKNPKRDSEFLKVYEEYDPENRYAVVADCAGGLGLDYSVCTVFNVTKYPYKIAAKYRCNTISPLVFPHTIMNIAYTYGEAPVLVESNGQEGGQVAYILYYELEYENMVLTSYSDKGIGGIRIGGKAGQIAPGVKTSVRSKAIGCANLKTLLETQDLEIEDQDIIDELGTFILQGNTYKADEDCNDDTVMTLVLFCWFIKQDFFSEYVNSNVGERAYSKAMQVAMEDVLPFGYVCFDGQMQHDASRLETHQSHSGMKVTTGYMTLEEWMQL